jgi:hypothetical protein
LEQQEQRQQQRFQITPRSGPLNGNGSLEVVTPLSSAVALNNFMNYVSAIEQQEQGETIYVGVQRIQQADASLLGNAIVLQPRASPACRHRLFHFCKMSQTVQRWQPISAL